ncbi:MAG TPA: DUF4384 domain-containing protein [Oscillatoriaceae cyanobacterium M33_DOE_052]|uniref:DUF4384 domain-containing protein n=1 Tax=Planktothricoides sp. SpSt-374 TaxID=2282167 RepID=A0A7C3ZNN0_9CYAN|nr:DUF4384 domain-containing protein [Oscillatoriaceae cyanobacterium M33_DOE_052]
MPMPINPKAEEEFLNAMADQWGFVGLRKLVFVQRFLTANDDLTRQALANVLDPKPDPENPDSDKFEQPVADCLRQIFPKLEAEGCKFNGATRDKVEIAKTWLRGIVYLWYQLKKQATPTTQMGPVLAKPGQTLNMWKPETQYRKEVPVGSQIQFEVNLERDGYLLLLEKGTSGQMWCLCPSFLAPQAQLSAGVARLPQETGRVKYFTLTGDGGKEEIVALIAKEPPPLPWLPTGNQPPLELNQDHLNDLLSYLNPRPDCQVWYTDYMVTKPSS